MKTHPLWAMRGTRSLLNQPLHPTVQREPRPNRNRVSKDGMILHRHLPLLSWKSFLNHPRTTPLDPTIPSNLTKGSHQEVANPKETVMMEIRETTGSLEVEANMVILVGNHQMDQTCLEGRQTGYRIDMETLETQMILEARVAPEILEDQEDQMETVDPDTLAVCATDPDPSSSSKSVGTCGPARSREGGTSKQPGGNTFHPLLLQPFNGSLLKSTCQSIGIAAASRRVSLQFAASHPLHLTGASLACTWMMLSTLKGLIGSTSSTIALKLVKPT